MNKRKNTPLSVYIKERSKSELKLVYFLYTLNIKEKSKQWYINNIKKYIISDVFYDNYTQLYNTLNKDEKQILEDYQASSVVINSYLRENVLKIRDYKTDREFTNDLNTYLSKKYLKNEKMIIDKKLQNMLNKYYNKKKNKYKLLLSSNIKTSLKIFRKLFKKIVLFDDIIVFRGSMHEEDKYDHILNKILDKNLNKKLDTKFINNKILIDKGIVSTTFYSGIAKRFSGDYNCCIYRYFLKKGTPCFIYPLNSRNLFLEYELILPPHKYRIIKINNIKSKYGIYKIIDLEIIKFLKF